MPDSLSISKVSDIQTRAEKKVAEFGRKRLLATAPALTPGQVQYLALHPEKFEEVRNEIGDDEVLDAMMRKATTKAG